MNINLTALIEAVIAVLGAIALRFIIPWIKSRTTESQREDLEAWARIAVAFVEQVYYQLSGEERLQKALELLEEQGFDIDSDRVRAAIEAEVLKLHQEMEAREAAIESMKEGQVSKGEPESGGETQSEPGGETPPEAGGETPPEAGSEEQAEA